MAGKATQTRRMPSRDERAVLGILKHLIRIRSENPPGGSRDILDFVKSYLVAHTRARTVYQRVSKTRALIIALFGTPRILLNAHLDTVPAAGVWKRNPCMMVHTQRRVYGLGTTDVKGAVAAMLAALKKETPQNLMLVFNADEEDGLGESISYFLDSPYARGIEHAIVTEPTGCNIVTSHKGLYIFQIVFRGRAAHASEPHQGVNAIEKAAGFVQVLAGYGDRINRRTCRDLKNPTISVDVIGGGTKSNIVPDTCRIEIDRRTLPGRDHSHAPQELRTLLKRHDPAARLEVLCSQPGFAGDRSSSLAGVLTSCGAHTQCSVADFWTEGALFSGAGMDTVVCGPGSSRQAHTTDEFIEASQLRKAYHLYRRLFNRL